MMLVTLCWQINKVKLCLKEIGQIIKQNYWIQLQSHYKSCVNQKCLLLDETVKNIAKKLNKDWIVKENNPSNSSLNSIIWKQQIKRQRGKTVIVHPVFLLVKIIFGSGSHWDRRLMVKLIPSSTWCVWRVTIVVYYKRIKTKLLVWSSSG